MPRSLVTKTRLLGDVPEKYDLPELRLLGQQIAGTVDLLRLGPGVHGWRKRHSRETAIDRIKSLGGAGFAKVDVVSMFTSVRQRRLQRLVFSLPGGYWLWHQIINSPGWPERGLPEGSPISPPLANLYMTGVIDGRWPQSITRYGDDICLNVFEPERELRRLIGRCNDLGFATHEHEVGPLIHFCGFHVQMRKALRKGVIITAERFRQADGCHHCEAAKATK
jgi:hypothetical protein